MFDHIGAMTPARKPAMDLRSGKAILIRMAIRIRFRALYGEICATLAIIVSR